MSAFPPLFAVDRTVLKRTYDYSTTGSIAFHVIMVNNNVVDVRNNDMRHDRRTMRLCEMRRNTRAIVNLEEEETNDGQNEKNHE